MGLKRKASALELDFHSTLPLQAQWQQQNSLQTTFHNHQPSSPPSLTSSAGSPGSSPSSMSTEPYHTTLQNAFSPSSYFSPTPAAPWLHTRTRKRVRDNRPSETQIHTTTMRLLFDAQRPHTQQSDDATMMMLDDYSPVPEPIIMPFDDNTISLDDDAQMTHLDTAPEANQRSIHDFFARQKGKEREQQPVVAASSHSVVQRLQHELHAPLLREKRSFGVLSGMNRASGDCGFWAAAGTTDALASEAALLAASAAQMVQGPVAAVGSCLPCDFRPAEEVRALMEDAMVMG